MGIGRSQREGHTLTELTVRTNETQVNDEAVNSAWTRRFHPEYEETPRAGRVRHTSVDTASGPTDGSSRTSIGSRSSTSGRHIPGRADGFNGWDRPLHPLVLRGYRTAVPRPGLHVRRIAPRNDGYPIRTNVSSPSEPSRGYVPREPGINLRLHSRGGHGRSNLPGWRLVRGCRPGRP